MTDPVYPTGKSIHHPLLHENNNITPRHRILFKYMITELREVLGEGNSHPPPPGYEKVWRIFLGVNISGKSFFVCHITEQCSTAHVHYCEDFSTVGSPVLLCIEPFHIKSKEMKLIQVKFPQHHCGHVPFQMALAITQKTSGEIQRNQPSFSALLYETKDKIFTPNFCAVPMTPSGILSLSFKAEDFPLEFCTYSRRTSAIFCALKKKLNENPPDIDSIILYQKACTLEMCFAKTENEYEISKHKLHLKEKEHRIVSDSLLVIFDSPNLPNANKLGLLQCKQEMLTKIEKEIQILQFSCNAKRAELLNQKTAIENFKKQKRKTLPSPYADTTFQIAMNMAFDNGLIVYKQFNQETENFDLSEDPEKKVSHQDFMKILYQD